MNIVQKADLFAEVAHNAVGQRRKYTLEPYIVHPREVMQIVESVVHNDAMLAAALLHDVVEDTHITTDVIQQHFGSLVSEYVYWLSNVSKPTDGNRAHRKLLDREHIARAPASAKTIKIADLISNTRSIVTYDVDFAKVYIKEKIALLDVLQEGDSALLNIAKNQISDAYLLLFSEHHIW